MPHPDFATAQRYAIDQLNHHLPAGITYHSALHTLNEVLPAVDRMIQAESVSDSGEQLLLRTAALFHDLGYTSAHLNHETVSAKIAASVLPELGYDAHQVETIQAMIMATRLPQSPHGLLEEILADADLDVLGSAVFFTRNLDLRNEMDGLFQPVSNETWFTRQIRFLQEHRYFTRSTCELREPGKQKNLRELERMLALAKQAQPLDKSGKNDRKSHS